MGAGFSPSFDTGKWIGFVTVIWFLSISCNNYIFSKYSHALKSLMALTQFQLNSLFVANDVGKAFGIFAGLASNRLPTPVILLIGSVEGFVSYGVQWLVVSQRIRPLPYWQMCILLCMGGNSTMWMNTAILVTCMRNFRKNRGPVSEILVGYVGLNTAIFTDLCTTIFSASPSKFLLMLAIIPAAVAWHKFMIFFDEIDELASLAAIISADEAAKISADEAAKISADEEESLTWKAATPRPLWNGVSQILMAIGYVIMAIGYVIMDIMGMALKSSFYIGSIIVGFCYGVRLAVSVPIASELFGLKYFGLIDYILILNLPLGSLLFSSLLASFLYDAQATGTAGGGNNCVGAHCYQPVFIVMLLMCHVGFGLDLLLAFRTRRLYSNIYRKKKKPEESSTAIRRRLTDAFSPTSPAETSLDLFMMKGQPSPIEPVL